MWGLHLYCTESVFWCQYTSLLTTGKQICCDHSTKPPASLSSPICADLSSRWFANSKQVPPGLTTAFSVHKSPSSTVNHNNVASNSDNLERPCVKMPIYACFPADRFWVGSALYCPPLRRSKYVTWIMRYFVILDSTSAKTPTTKLISSYLFVFQPPPPLFSPLATPPSAQIGHLYDANHGAAEQISKFIQTFCPVGDVKHKQLW